MGRRQFIAAIGLAMLLPLAACSPAPTPDSISRCVASNFPSYNPKNREQCIAACIKCENGVMTTCATSCSLKGSR
ncbi:hypothetical protein [Bradyrhizobium sp.]|uniref:hypothetical protein n=1 Tax=Bradyrhizobium sp. TaxID=376 RepID=UPI001D53FA02|nr:hypothetical protein [Bradyrhizobium sp.]MBI5320117.1 hypothetical protein [Bradyrhizobium sp.]